MPVVLVTPEELARANKALHELGEKRWLGELAQRVSAAGMKFVADGFNTSTDPYGKPWPPLAHQRTRDRRAAARKMRRAARIAGSLDPYGNTWGGGLAGMMTPAFQAPVKGAKVLIDTSRMRSSAGASPRGRTARIIIPTWYARVHQGGVFIRPHSRIRTQVMAHKAKLHQAGFQSYASTRRATFARGFRIPQRMMLPDEQRGLPEKWNAMMESEADKLLWQKLGVRR